MTAKLSLPMQSMANICLILRCITIFLLDSRYHITCRIHLRTGFGLRITRRQRADPSEVGCQAQRSIPWQRRLVSKPEWAQSAISGGPKPIGALSGRAGCITVVIGDVIKLVLVIEPHTIYSYPSANPDYSFHVQVSLLLIISKVCFQGPWASSSVLVRTVLAGSGACVFELQLTVAPLESIWTTQAVLPRC